LEKDVKKKQLKRVRVVGEEPDEDDAEESNEESDSEAD
jgi:hypothetical protein